MTWLWKLWPRTYCTPFAKDEDDYITAYFLWREWLWLRWGQELVPVERELVED